MSRVCIEICADGLDAAVAAAAGRAHRVELCADLSVDGLTPAAETIARVRARLKVGLMVMVRPRPGDFVYTGDEIAAMAAEVERARALGADGVVVGALTAEGRVDAAACRELVAAAGPLPVTFHRAFDRVRDRKEALETLVVLGFERVLTSGGAASAWDGRDELAELQRRAAGRIVIIAGGGVRAGHAHELVRRTGVTELHSSAGLIERGARREPDSQRVRELVFSVATA